MNFSCLSNANSLADSMDSYYPARDAYRPVKTSKSNPRANRVIRDSSAAALNTAWRHSQRRRIASALQSEPRSRQEETARFGGLYLMTTKVGNAAMRSSVYQTAPLCARWQLPIASGGSKSSLASAMCAVETANEKDAVRCGCGQ